MPDPKPRRYQQRKNNKLKTSRTESDITRNQDPRMIQLPGANELKERIVQAKNVDVKTPILGKLGRKPSQETKVEDDQTRYRRFVKKLDEPMPIQLGKLRRAPERAGPDPQLPPPVLKISAFNQAAKDKFFGLEPKKEKTMDELAAAVRKYIPPVSAIIDFLHISQRGYSLKGAIH